MPIKAYCINLDERKDRWESFITQPIGIPVERFSAVKRDKGNEGCLLSHLGVMRKCEDEVLIFEDDCKLLQPWSVFERAYRQLPKSWDALWLGANVITPLKRYSENLFRLQSGWTTHGILWKKKIIDKILTDGFDTIIKYKNFDTYLARVIQPKFNCYIIYPCFATQSTSFSDIVHYDRDYTIIESNFTKNTTNGFCTHSKHLWAGGFPA
jgi:hypothetical protein